MRPRRLESIEISLSLRMHDCAGPCAYVYALSIRSDGQRALIDSRHFTGDPLQLLDAASGFIRELQMEHFLPLTSPF